MSNPAPSRVGAWLFTASSLLAVAACSDSSDGRGSLADGPGNSVLSSSESDEVEGEPCVWKRSEVEAAADEPVVFARQEGYTCVYHFKEPYGGNRVVYSSSDATTDDCAGIPDDLDLGLDQMYPNGFSRDSSVASSYYVGIQTDELYGDSARGYNCSSPYFSVQVTLPDGNMATAESAVNDLAKLALARS